MYGEIWHKSWYGEDNNHASGFMVLDITMEYYHEHPKMVGESICKVDFSDCGP